MDVVGALIRLLARCFKTLERVFRGLSDLLNRLLPALLSHSELTELVTDHYETVYKEQDVPLILNAPDYQLSNAEMGIIDRCDRHSGRILVLGCGWGREALAIARRDITAVGVDTNRSAVSMARRLAKIHGVPAHFHQANFLTLPYAPTTFDAIFLPSVMYSSIAGMVRRQTWLTELGLLLKPNGLVMLSFFQEHHPVSRLKLLTTRLNLLLVKLPGANRAYQRGDDCPGGHFLHAFQDEEEIRMELVGARTIIRELNWARGFAVLAYPPHPHPNERRGDS